MNFGFQLAQGLVVFEAICNILAVILRELLWNRRGVNILNDFIFPNQKSTLVGEMDFYDYEIPEEYKDIPWFNF